MALERCKQRESDGDSNERSGSQNRSCSSSIVASLLAICSSLRSSSILTPRIDPCVRRGRVGAHEVPEAAAPVQHHKDVHYNAEEPENARREELAVQLFLPNELVLQSLEELRRDAHADHVPEMAQAVLLRVPRDKRHNGDAGCDEQSESRRRMCLGVSDERSELPGYSQRFVAKLLEPCLVFLSSNPASSFAPRTLPCPSLLATPHLSSR